MHSHRGGHEANLLSVRDATRLCREPENDREFCFLVSTLSAFHFPFPTLSLWCVGAFDLIYPLLDNLSSIPSSPTFPLHKKGLSERRRRRRLYGLERWGISARRPHDRQPSITHDPVCDAWIDRQVRPHFRLFGSYLSPPHEISFRPKQGSLIRFRATLFESQLF